MPDLKSKGISPVSKSDADRFWSHVQRDNNGPGCWLWVGSKNGRGYGRFFLQGHHFYAHRVSWQLAGREVPADRQLFHTCDNPLCVNPDHLTANRLTRQSILKPRQNVAAKRAAIKKPREDFPLFVHATGRWAKKVRGKLVYFGQTINDPKGESALQLWLDQKDDLLGGRVPHVASDALTVRDICNRFLTAKEQLRDAGDLAAVTFTDYLRTCAAIVVAFGRTHPVDDLATDDFEALRAKLAKQYGVHRLGNMVQRIRSVFKYAFEAGLIDKPIRFGPSFKRPSARRQRLHRQKSGDRMFEPDDLRKIISNAGQPLRAMILLGINCGFGNSDCGTLPFTALDLDAGWVHYPRPKTGVERRCPLWPETVAALKEAIAERPNPKLPEHTELVFITKYGGAWAKKTEDNPVTKEMRKLLDDRVTHTQSSCCSSLCGPLPRASGAEVGRIALEIMITAWVPPS